MTSIVCVCVYNASQTLYVFFNVKFVHKYTDTHTHTLLIYRWIQLWIIEAANNPKIQSDPYHHQQRQQQQLFDDVHE